MPDPLKIAALERAGVRAVPVCASCINFVTGSKAGRDGVPAWGSCAIVQAGHERHTGGCRASVRADMTCDRHAITGAADADMIVSGMDHLRARTLAEAMRPRPVGPAGGNGGLHQMRDSIT